MLAGFWDHVEQTSAECIRSFPVVPFLGSEWLSMLDAVTEQKHKVDKHSQRKAHFKLSELYGWRGADPRVYYLSPWEFVKWWEVKALQPPSATQPLKSCLSEWVPGHDSVAKPPDGWKFGRDFVWKAAVPQELQERLDELDAPLQPGPEHSNAQPNPMEPVRWSYGTLTPENVAAWRQQLP
eukprot:s556_g29.t1